MSAFTPHFSDSPHKSRRVDRFKEHLVSEIRSAAKHERVAGHDYRGYAVKGCGVGKINTSAVRKSSIRQKIA